MTYQHFRQPQWRLFLIMYLQYWYVFVEMILSDRSNESLELQQLYTNIVTAIFKFN